MKVLPISDTHFEYDGIDEIGLFIDSLAEADIVILAGDICNNKNLDFCIELFCSKYNKVLYVPGNHEFWHKEFDEVIKEIKRLEDKYFNFIPLWRDSILIDGVRFLGIVGFPEIIPFTNKVADLGKMIQPHTWLNLNSIKDWEWIEQEIKWFWLLEEHETKVFISHFTPTEYGIHEDFKNHPLNWYFCLDKTELLKRINNKSYWISGHIHNAYQKQINNCLALANPRGYKYERRLNKFNKDLILDIK